ncbi:MAG: glutamate mutase L [Bacillota bacterium]|jgi:hypothetical protein
MAREILHLDIGNTVTTARLLSRSSAGLKPISSAVVPTPGASSEVDLVAGAEAAYTRAKSGASAHSLSQPDNVLVTVSAAGEPRVVCAGVVRGISGESAKRAALAAGATVADLLAVDDGRHEYQRVSDLRRQIISMVVMAGGVDEEILGSGRHQLFNIAKTIAEGLPERRSGGGKVPVIYAASQEGREEVLRILGDSVDIVWADNVRSRLEEEHLESARNAIVQAFANGVRHDSRFSGLGRFGSPAVMPSGHAAGMTVDLLSRANNENVLAISLTGDTVEVFSVIKGVFTRTVTSTSRVQAKDVVKWLPSAGMARDVAESLANWQSSPGALPATWDDLAVFLAFQKEAVRAAIAEHSESAIELRGIHRQRQIGETFQVGVQGGETLVKMERIGSVFLTGFLTEILTPQALLSVVLDAVLPCGLTKVYADRNGLMQSYGVLSQGDPAFLGLSAMQALGVVVSPGRNEERVGSRWAYLNASEGLRQLPVQHGEIAAVALSPEERVEFELHPAAKVDLGDGEGRRYRAAISGFNTAYIDGRPRVMRSSDFYSDNRKWYRSLRVFPPDVLSAWERRRD